MHTSSANVIQNDTCSCLFDDQVGFANSFSSVSFFLLHRAPRLCSLTCSYVHKFLTRGDANEGGFYDVNYLGIITSTTLFATGVIIFAMRLHPHWGKARPGKVNRRELYGCFLCQAVAALPLAAGLLHQSVLFMTFGTPLNHTIGTGLLGVLGFLVLAANFAMFGYSSYSSQNVARSYVEADEQVYNELWARLLISDKVAIDDLSKSCDSVSCPKVRPHQPMNSNDSFECFCEIFRLSTLLHPHVQAKGAEWAAIGQARLGDDSITQLAAPLKTHRRAIEKLWRAYAGDVRCLMDISRIAIVCTTIAQLSFFVGLIRDDPDTEVLRCKNRFKPAFDSSTTAGYRDVQFSVKMKTRDVINAGARDIVFEVQLLLESVYALKTDEGHVSAFVPRSCSS